MSAARLLAAALTPIERQHLVAHLEMTAAWLADEVTGPTAAQIEFHPTRRLEHRTGCRPPRGRGADLLAGSAARLRC